MKKRSTIVMIIGLIAATPSAYAQCWSNPDLTQLSEDIVVEHFPDYGQDLPAIYECPPEEMSAETDVEFIPEDDVILVSASQRDACWEDVWNGLGYVLGYAFLSRRDIEPEYELDQLLVERGLAVE